MKIAIGSDHAGFPLKEAVRLYLIETGHEVVDEGTYSLDSVDYPVFGEKVARAVVSGEVERGVIFCGTGAGISMAANKVPGARCVLASEPYTVALSRQHNDANILAMGARVVGEGLAFMIVDQFLSAKNEGGRHARRVEMLAILDKNKDTKKTVLSQEEK